MDIDQYLRPNKTINQFTLLAQNDAADYKYKLNRTNNANKIRAINRLVHIDEDQSYLTHQPQLQPRIAPQQSHHSHTHTHMQMQMCSPRESQQKSTNIVRSVFFEDCTSQDQSNFSESQSLYQGITSRTVEKPKNYLQNQVRYDATPVNNNKNLKISHAYSHTEKREPSISTQVSLEKRFSENKNRLSTQQVLAVVHIQSPQRSQKSLETRESIAESLTSSEKISRNLVNYSNYCSSCDDFMSTGPHCCTRKLYNLDQISKSLQRISLMIEQTKMTKYTTLPELINNTNKLHELRVFFDFLKKQKNNLILLPQQWNQHSQIILQRLINVCGKKISLVF